MLEVYVKENKLPNKKSPFTFHSRCPQKISTKEFIEKVASSGCTVTATDIVAVFSSSDQVFRKLITEGFSIELPLGTFKANASGTAQKETEHFNANNGTYDNARITDHKISLNFKPSNELSSYICRRTRVQRIKNFFKCSPSFSSITVKELECGNDFPVNSVVKITGDYLKIDFSDSEQGLFLLNEQTEELKRIDFKHFIHNARKTLIFTLPSDIPLGTYCFCLKNKPKMTLLEVVSSQYNIISS